jgi:hypothetical protein
VLKVIRMALASLLGQLPTVFRSMGLSKPCI